MRRLRMPLRAAVAGVLAVQLLVLLVGATTAAPPSLLAGSAPSWATTGNLVGPADPAATVSFRVYLRWRDQAALDRLAQAVSDPASPAYGQVLSPAAFRERFAPTPESVAAVRSWLRDRGLRVGYVPDNARYVSATGTVAAAGAAFGATIRTYRVQGKLVQAPDRSLSVPASLAGVDAVVGLDDSSLFVKPQHAGIEMAPATASSAPGTYAPPPPAFVNARPCSAWWGEQKAHDLPSAFGEKQPYGPCGYTPAQLRGAYGLTDLIAHGIDGSGQTVAVTDAFLSSTLLKDLNTWSVHHGLPPMAKGQFRIVAPPGLEKAKGSPGQDPQGWSVEQTLDVEAVHAMAPGANIVYVGSKDAAHALDAALNHTVDAKLAQIITNSWGFPTEVVPAAFIRSLHGTFLQAVATGIGVYFASGDSGDEIQAVGYRTANFPASDPWVTAVGGTTLGVGKANNYLFETGWGTGKSDLVDDKWSPRPAGPFVYGSGGGASCLFERPSYQRKAVPSKISRFEDHRMCGDFRGRAVPDVAVVGDPNTGMMIGQTQTFPDGSVRFSEWRLGGTSLASPLMAGIMALADQAKGSPHGFANPALYAAGRSAFRDVREPDDRVAMVRVDYVNHVDARNGLMTSLRTSGVTGSLDVRRGYDDVTGLGSPRGLKFLESLLP